MGNEAGVAEDRFVARAVAGDRDALSALLERSGEQVARGLEGKLGRRWRRALDVDDIMQVAFLEAFLQIEGLAARDSRSFLAWFRRIAENNLIDAIRGLRSEKRGGRLGGESSDRRERVCDLVGLVGGTTSTPSRHAAAHETAEWLEGAVARLPSDYAQVVRLYDLEGLSAPEVGRRIGRSRGAVHMLRSRALTRLRELLGSETNFFSSTA